MINVPVVILLVHEKTKLLEQLKVGFKQTVSWNKYLYGYKHYAPPNWYLHHLIDSRFQGTNRLFVLSFQNEAGRTVHTGYRRSSYCGNKRLPHYDGLPKFF